MNKLKICVKISGNVSAGSGGRYADLTRPAACRIINAERALRQAVSSYRFMFSQGKPSLARVAVFAFYTDRDCISEDM